jgi:hypothetical protein
MIPVAELLQLIGAAIAEEPAIEGAIRKVLTKEKTTPADWKLEGDAWRAATYESLVPDTKLPPDPVPSGVTGFVVEPSHPNAPQPTDPAPAAPTES